MQRRATNEIILPSPHRGQLVVRSQMQRHNFLCAGRRWRKTTLALAVMVEAVLRRPGEYVWAAPTYKQVRRGWEEMRRAAEGVADFNESRMEARFPEGAVVYFLSMEKPDNTRGYTSFGTVLDEASEIAEDAYRKVLRPMLSDTEGWLLAFGTPKGRNWFFAEFQAVMSGDRAGSSAWQVPTLGARVDQDERTGEYVLVREPHPLENPHFPWAELQNEFSGTTVEAFKQEYLAEFLLEGGAAFGNVDACAHGTLLDGPTHPLAEYVAGIDLAKHEDYTVVCVADKRDRRVVAFERWNRSDWPLTKARIAGILRHWNNAVAWMDATGVGDPIFDDLHREGLRVNPYRISAQTRTPLLENAILQVEQRRVSYPAIPVLLNELKAMAPHRMPSGLIRYEVPAGMHDDCIFGFALCVWPFANGGASSLASWGTDFLDQLARPASQINGVKLLRRGPI